MKLVAEKGEKFPMGWWKLFRRGWKGTCFEICSNNTSILNTVCIHSKHSLLDILYMVEGNTAKICLSGSIALYPNIMHWPKFDEYCRLFLL